MGGLNGIFQIIGSICKPIRDKMQNALGMDRDTFSHKFLKICITFTLVDFTWIFFRASTITDAFIAIKSIFTMNNIWILFDDSLYTLGLDRKNFNLMLISIVVLLLADVIKRKKISVKAFLDKQEWWFRWAIYIIAVNMILLFGIWGSNYDQSGFIYFQF